MSMKSLELSRSTGELTQLDWKFHFFAWWQDPEVSRRRPRFRCGDEQGTSGILRRGGEGNELHHQRRAAPVVRAERGHAAWGDEAGVSQHAAGGVPHLRRRVFDPIATMEAEGDCMAPLIVYDIDPVTGRREGSQA